MTDAEICPACNRPLGADAPQGLCPQCLIRAGLATSASISMESAGDAGTGRFVPPPVEEIARRFPQLEIISLLGRGGMGAVYKARQMQLDRIVALKILPPGVDHEAQFAERFAREARAGNRLLRRRWHRPRRPHGPFRRSPGR